jgi:DNA-binding transcriptional LysR family regulator
MQPIHLSDINLNLLAVLDALLSERSVTRAALHLGLTQSATSHALRRLRQFFNDPLLVRGSAGMVPTALAEELAAPVRSGLLELQRAVRGELSFEPNQSSRTFSVATVDHPLLTGLPKFFEHAAISAPDIGLNVVPFTSGLAKRLEVGEVDLVLAGAEAEMILALDSGLMRTMVISEDFVCVARKNHPLLKRKTLDLETYTALPHLLVSTTGTGPGIADTVLAQQGLERRIAVRIPYFSGAPHLLARSNLIATLPKAMAEAGRRIAPLEIYKPPIKLPRSEAFLWWHERFQRDPGHAWLRNAMLEAFASYRD